MPDEWIEAEPADSQLSAPAVDAKPAAPSAEARPKPPRLKAEHLSTPKVELPPAVKAEHLPTPKAAPRAVLPPIDPADVTTLESGRPPPIEVHVSVTPPSEAPPPPEPARAQAPPPPLPPAPPPVPEPKLETRPPDSSSIPAAAAGSMTLPGSSQIADASEKVPLLANRRKKTRVVVGAVALLAIMVVWAAQRSRTTPAPVEAAVDSASSKDTALAAQAQRALPQTAANLRVEPAPSAAPPDTPPTPSEPAPQPIAAAPAVAPASAAIPPPAPPEVPKPAAAEARADLPAAARTVAAAAPTPRAAPAPSAAKPEKLETELPDPSSARAKSNLDDEALQQALGQAAQRAKGCHVAGGPTGNVRVSVTFAPSGDVIGAVVSGALFSNTVEGECIAAKFRNLHIPPFSGNEIVVRKTVTID